MNYPCGSIIKWRCLWETISLLTKTVKAFRQGSSFRRNMRRSSRNMRRNSRNMCSRSSPSMLNPFNSRCNSLSIGSRFNSLSINNRCNKHSLSISSLRSNRRSSNMRPLNRSLNTLSRLNLSHSRLVLSMARIAPIAARSTWRTPSIATIAAITSIRLMRRGRARRAIRSTLRALRIA